MAGSANEKSVGAAIRPPEFRKAVQLCRGGIRAKKDSVAEKNKKIGDDYNTIEGYGVHRKAAKIFMSLDKLESDERVEIFRSLNGLADAAEWPENADPDLADQAEGKVVPLRVGAAKTGGEEGKGDDASEDKPKGARGGAKAGLDALETARAKLSKDDQQQAAE